MSRIELMVAAIATVCGYPKVRRARVNVAAAVVFSKVAVLPDTMVPESEECPSPCPLGLGAGCGAVSEAEESPPPKDGEY